MSKKSSWKVPKQAELRIREIPFPPRTNKNVPTENSKPRFLPDLNQEFNTTLLFLLNATKMSDERFFKNRTTYSTLLLSFQVDCTENRGCGSKEIFDTQGRSQIPILMICHDLCPWGKTDPSRSTLSAWPTYRSNRRAGARYLDYCCSTRFLGWICTAQLLHNIYTMAIDKRIKTI